MGIGRRIKEARESLGLTQKELGKIIGVTASAITNYESDTSHPKEAILYKLLEALRVDANFLFQDCIKTSVKNFTLTLKEHGLISDYRRLDKYGRQLVQNVLRLECERVQDMADGLENISKEYAPLRRLKYYESPVSAGTGEYLDNAYNRTIEVPLTPETKRADFVVRVSGDSMEPDFFDGDELLVEAAPAIDENELGIFIVNDEGLFKKQGVGRLISLNKNYADIRLHDYDSVYCRGRVIGKL